MIKLTVALSLILLASCTHGLMGQSSLLKITDKADKNSMMSFTELYTNTEGMCELNKIHTIDAKNLFAFDGWTISIYGNRSELYTNLKYNEMIQDLKKEFGEHNLTLKKQSSDSLHVISYFLLTFKKIQNCKNVLEFFLKYHNVYCGFSMPFNRPVNQHNDRTLNPSKSICENQREYPSYFYQRSYHERGWAWHHYSIKTPLAWEITLGQDTF